MIRDEDLDGLDLAEQKGEAGVVWLNRHLDYNYISLRELLDEIRRLRGRDDNLIVEVPVERQEWRDAPGKEV